MLFRSSNLRTLLADRGPVVVLADGVVPSVPPSGGVVLRPDPQAGRRQARLPAHLRAWVVAGGRLVLCRPGGAATPVSDARACLPPYDTCLPVAAPVEGQPEAVPGTPLLLTEGRVLLSREALGQGEVLHLLASAPLANEGLRQGGHPPRPCGGRAPLV